MFYGLDWVATVPPTVRLTETLFLAALSPKDTVTIPSVTANSPSKVMVAQAGGTRSGSSSGDEFLGLSKNTWFWIGVAAAFDAAAVGLGIAIYENNKGHYRRVVPVCP